MKRTHKIQELLNVAFKSGFDLYGSFNEGLQHEILVCTNGEYNGEVIDIYWNYFDGSIHTIDISTQFKNQIARFNFNNSKN